MRISRMKMVPVYENVNLKFLNVYLETNYNNMYYLLEDIGIDTPYGTTEEFLKKYPSLYAKTKETEGFYLKIDIDTGEVVNLPEEFKDLSIRNLKIVDSGIYVLTNEDGEPLYSRYGYVPDCLQIDENGYGDYIEMTVKDGFIENWKFTVLDVNKQFNRIDDLES